MRFRFNPNKTSHSKHAKVEETPVEALKEVPQELIEQPKWVPQNNKAMPKYPGEEINIGLPECAKNEEYLCLYQAYFNHEVDRMLSYYGGYQDYVYFCKLMKDGMNRFLDKEREMKRLYSNNTEDQSSRIKCMEIQAQLNEYRNQINKLRKAENEIDKLLSSDLNEHPMVVQLVSKCDEIASMEQFDEQLFLQKIHEFELKNSNIRLNLERKVQRYMATLLKDKETLEHKYRETQREIEQIECQFGQPIVRNCKSFWV